MIAAALAADTLTLPAGRVAVLAPQVAPQELIISNPSVIDVQPVMPWLIVYGKSAGASTLGVVHADGRKEWAVSVGAEASAPVAGDGLLRVESTSVPLSVDGGVLLPWPDDATALAIVEPAVVAAQRFGDDWLWIQGDAGGTSDVVVERGEEPPQVFTVVVGEGGAAPAGAHEVGEPVALAAGGEAVLTFPTRPAGMLVAHRGRLTVEEDPERPGSVRLRGRRAGTSWVLFGFSDGSVVVRPVHIGG